jgi:hypothetical protein
MPTSTLTGYANATEVANKLNEVNSKVDKVTGKGLSTEDYTTAEKSKLANIEDNANSYTLPNATSSVAGGLKVRLDGTDLYLTNNGTPA